MNWMAGTQSAFERRERYTRNGVKPYTARGLRGFARRVVDGKEQFVKCGHVHHKRSAAMQCATDLAKSLNKEEQESQS